MSKADSLLDEAIKNVSDKVATLEKSGYDDTELKNLISDNTNSINQLINEKQDKNLGEYNEVMYPEVVSDKFMSINKDMTVNEAIHTVESNVATLVDETIKNETVTANAITFIKESVGLNDNLNYESNIDTVYISDATSFAEADSLLDKAIKSTNDRIDSLGELEFDDTELKGLINEKQDKVLSDYVSVSYPVFDDVSFQITSNNDTVTTAINNVESNLVTLIDETIKNEEVVAQAITSIKDSIGLNDNLNYESNANTVYISGATSLYEADSLLDEAIKNTNSEISNALLNKVDKVDGKQLSSEDFTSLLKEKLENLSNYDDTTINNTVNKLRNDFDSLVNSDTNGIIDKFNEIVTFLNNIEDSNDLDSILKGINDSILEVSNSIPNGTKDLVNDAEFITKTGAEISESYQSVSYDERTKDLFTPVTSGQTLDDAIYTVESNIATLVLETIDNEKVVAAAITDVKDSIGLDENLNYNVDTNATYISGATTLSEADSLLDKAIKSANDRIDSLGELEFDDTELKGLINELQTSKQNVLINEYEEKTYPVIDDVEWKQVSNGDTITTAFDNIESNLVTLIDETIKNEEVIAQAITTIKDSIGLNDNIQYEPNENAIYISGATSLIDADSLLDKAIKSANDRIDSLGEVGFDDTELKALINEKQDIISDLETIRSGAALGTTALQTVPEGYVTEVELDSKKYATENYVDTKIDNLINEYEEKSYPVIDDVEWKQVSNDNTVANAISNVEDNLITLIDETIKNENVIAQAITTIKDSTGLSDNLTYAINSNATYISNATSLSEADSLLDGAIKSISDRFDILLSGNTSDAIDNYQEIINFLDNNKDTENLINLLNEKISENDLSSVALSGNYNDLSNKPLIPTKVSELENDKNYISEIKLSNNYNVVEYNDKVSQYFTPASSGQTLDEAIHTVESNVATLVDETIKNENVIAQAITTIKDSIGLNDNIQYESNANTVYISGATSLYEADSLLDEAIKNTNDRIDSLGELEFDDTELKGLINELQTSKQNVLINEYEEKTYPVIDDIEWKQVSNGNTITVAINNIEDNLVTLIDETIKNEEVVAQVITTIKDSIGLNDNIQYEPNENAVYISGATSLIDADSLLDEAISSKQDVISDLENIRSGAALGATALQTVPEGYVTLSDLESLIGVATDDDINNIFN